MLRREEAQSRLHAGLLGISSGFRSTLCTDNALFDHGTNPHWSGPNPQPNKQWLVLLNKPQKRDMFHLMVMIPVHPALIYIPKTSPNQNRPDCRAVKQTRIGRYPTMILPHRVFSSEEHAFHWTLLCVDDIQIRVCDDWANHNRNVPNRGLTELLFCTGTHTTEHPIVWKIYWDNKTVWPWSEPPSEAAQPWAPGIYRHGLSTLCFSPWVESTTAVHKVSQMWIRFSSEHCTQFGELGRVYLPVLQAPPA